MPRFVARPIFVEAHQFLGHTHELPNDFRVAVTRHLQAGGVEVMTGDGARQCRHYDWIVRGPEGQFSVIRAAAFEAGYEAKESADARATEAFNLGAFLSEEHLRLQELVRDTQENAEVERAGLLAELAKANRTIADGASREAPKTLTLRKKEAAL